MSDDHKFGLTIIAFIGSVFSPYYAFARRRGIADPDDHVAINVALYGRGVRRWTMTERGRGALTRNSDELEIGTSRMRWSGGALEIEIDELAVPVPRRVRGTVRFTPSCLPGRCFAIDREHRHIWQPIAPIGQVDVSFEQPALRWCGGAYLDHNRGSEPLEDRFVRWDWSRQEASDTTQILYDLTPRGGPDDQFAVRITRSGEVERFTPPPRRVLAPTLWRVARATRCDVGSKPRVLQQLEDAPFYSRALIETEICGNQRPSVHESLDLDRFRSTVVQAMLPFRMPRRAR